MLDEDYLQYRIRSSAYVVEKLDALGVPVVRAAGRARHLPRRRGLLPHSPAAAVPGPGAGLRALPATPASAPSRSAASCSAATTPATGEFQPAMLSWCAWRSRGGSTPRATSTTWWSASAEVFAQRDKIRGMRIAWEPPILRHFTARFESL